MRTAEKDNAVIGGKGQTVIETVAMLVVLFTIFFLIAEFARAWYLKNSLNNAARVTVRAAVVNSTNAGIDNSTCPSGNAIVQIACDSPGVPNNVSTRVTVSINGDADAAESNPGDMVTVFINTPFSTFVPGLLKFMPSKAYSEATMRQEL